MLTCTPLLYGAVTNCHGTPTRPYSVGGTPVSPADPAVVITAPSVQQVLSFVGGSSASPASGITIDGLRIIGSSMPASYVYACKGTGYGKQHNKQTPYACMRVNVSLIIFSLVFIRTRPILADHRCLSLPGLAHHRLVQNVLQSVVQTLQTRSTPALGPHPTAWSSWKMLPASSLAIACCVLLVRAMNIWYRLKNYTPAWLLLRLLRLLLCSVA